MKISTDLQISISVALTEAASRRHDYAGVEHLLAALVLDDATAKVLEHAGADIPKLKLRLTEFLDEIEPAIDGRAVTIMFLVMSPAEDPESHLQCLRWISTLARNSDFRRFLLDADTEAQIRDLLREMCTLVHRGGSGLSREWMRRRAAGLQATLALRDLTLTLTQTPKSRPQS